MYYLIAMLSLVMFMIFTAARIIQFYRIVKEYKNTTQAKVIKVSSHPKKKKKEKPALDVVLAYDINGKEGLSEVVVPATMAEQYTLNKEFTICYKVSPNGAVHIASYSAANKKMLMGHIAAFVLEVVAFVIIWLTIL